MALPLPLPVARPPGCLQIDSRPVTPEWLSMRSVYISPEQSRTIQSYLIKIGVLDANGEVQYDVRVVSGGWGALR